MRFKSLKNISSWMLGWLMNYVFMNNAWKQPWSVKSTTLVFSGRDWATVRKPSVGLSVSRPTFELGTSLIKIRSVTIRFYLFRRYIVMGHRRWSSYIFTWALEYTFQFVLPRQCPEKSWCRLLQAILQYDGCNYTWYTLQGYMMLLSSW
jgi:hypothetical protein